MILLNYERLYNLVKESAPFRGTTNRYPIASRAHNLKHFFVRREDGHDVYDIANGWHNKQTQITEEEANTINKKVFSYQDNFGKVAYYSVEQLPNVVGTVKPDNTLEISTPSYGMSYSEKYFLSQWDATGCITSESRRGGTLYRSLRRGVMVPIFNGLKLSCENNTMPVGDLKVYSRKVNRKRGSELIKDYDSFFKRTQAMVKSMDSESHLNMLSDIIETYSPDITERMRKGLYVTDSEVEGLFDKAFPLVKEAPLDAFSLMFIAKMPIARRNLTYMLRNVIGSRGTNWWAYEPTNYLESFLTKARRELYLRNVDVFDLVEHGTAGYLPQCTWGYKIIYNGQEVEQL